MMFEICVKVYHLTTEVVQKPDLKQLTVKPF